MTEPSAEPVTFDALGEYELPPMPAVHALRGARTGLALAGAAHAGRQHRPRAAREDLAAQHLQRNAGARALQCVASVYLEPQHDAALAQRVLTDVALTSAYLGYDQPVVVVLSEAPWGTHYKLRAYPFDMRDPFAFINDLTVRGKLALADAGAKEVSVPAAFRADPAPGSA